MARIWGHLATLLSAIKGKGHRRAEEMETDDLAATKPYVFRAHKHAYVTIAKGPPTAHRETALEPGLTVGRGAHCRLLLDNQAVSRTHAHFIRDGAGWQIVDLGSTNGTFVNGQRVASTLLQAGDRIKIGPFVLIYRER